MPQNTEGIRRGLRLILITVAIGLMSYSFMDSFKSYVETKKREQARYNLEHITHCLTRVERVIEKLGDEECENAELLDKAVWNTCTKGVRTSSTGDVYVLDRSDCKFVYDNSNDVPEKVLYFTEESIGGLFKDWDSAVKARQLMTSGNDSTATTRGWYNFDGHPEWLEWKMWEHDDKSYVVIQGIQSDEVYASMQEIEYMYYVFMFIIVGVLPLEVNAVPKDNRCRRRSDGN